MTSSKPGQEDEGTPAKTPEPGLPEWLPDLMPFTGDWSVYVEKIWAAYKGDFRDRRAQWRGRDVLTDVDPLVSGKDFGFWHIGSGIDVTSKELLVPDLPRCARICWVRPILEAPEDEVRTWVQPGSGRTAIAVPDFSYVVVLKEGRNVVFLKTAYVIERPSRRTQMRNEYEKAGKR
jgi:hypothetical protein